MPTTSLRNPAPPKAAAMRQNVPTKTAASSKTTPLGFKLQQANINVKKRNQQRSARSSTSRAKPLARRSRGTKKKLATGKKRYRRVKKLRWWVLPAIFFVPLGIILLEYYIGKLISLEDVKDTYYKHLGIDPWELRDVPTAIGAVPSIANLTGSVKTKGQCPELLKGMINLHNPKSHLMGNRTIPMILHQHGPSRCMTRTYYTAAVQWASTLKRWSYYFHDDLAVDRLVLDHVYPEFPLLKIVAKHCLGNLTRTSLGVELWKFLTLWLYGGVYVDLNYRPGSFDGDFINVKDDGLFFVDTATNTFHTGIMAASPRHPLMFYAVRRLLDDFVEGKANNSRGEEALREALADFQKTKYSFNDSLAAGTFQGPGNRSIRIIKDVEKNGLVKRVFETEVETKDEYEKMGWDLLAADATDGMGGQCLRKVLGKHLD